MTDLIGLSINQYRLEKLLGDGGMGTVYMADDTNLERTVAIKLMQPYFYDPHFHYLYHPFLQTYSPLVMPLPHHHE